MAYWTWKPCKIRLTSISLYLCVCVLYVRERNRNILFWSSYHVCVFFSTIYMIQTKAKGRTSVSHNLNSQFKKNPSTFLSFSAFLHLNFKNIT
ncbi:hypothetical protein L6452_29631 [Arctium lappa]|uniref:Uncharacterized protein n=1 Tax=Arctium lappa TaxID=4217 RepID=A0ACB8ZG30_ARCLA|nr:hypothetical protein L6452_29631 [Arctium lappa]